MTGAFSKLLEVLTCPVVQEKEPLDKMQLEAAQDRLHTRSDELDKSVDELSKMIKRMKRRTVRRKQ